MFDHGSDFPLFAASTVEDALAYVRLKMRREREAEPARDLPHASMTGHIWSAGGPSGDPTRPRHETVADTADLNQYGRNALAHAVNRRRA